ncbi:MAG: cupin domain-containing protein [Alphaproteobacteria bacterium]
MTDIPFNRAECDQRRIEAAGYTIYDLASDTSDNWGVVILDIDEAPTHFHKIGHEHFLVLSGKLHVTSNGKAEVLTPGQGIHIKPGTDHKLKSATPKPVRVLCVNFPIFDRGDLYTAD